MVGRLVNDANPYPFRQKESAAGKLPTALCLAMATGGWRVGADISFGKGPPRLPLKRG
jgi:hypothetical protein